MISRLLRLVALSAICILPIVHAGAYGGMDSDMVNEMLTEINELRAKSNKGKLQLDDQLMRAAQLHTEDQARNGIMTHDGKRLDSKLNLGDRVKKQGFKFSSCAENVAAGQKSVKDVMRSWIKSPGHLRNLLSNNECVGVGHAKSTKGRYGNYWTQVFGTRRGGKCVYTGENSVPTDPPTESPSITPVVTTVAPVQTTSPPTTTIPPTTTSVPVTTIPPTTTSSPVTTISPITTSPPETTSSPELNPSPPIYPATPPVTTTNSPCTIDFDYDAIWALIQKHLGELTKIPDQPETDYPSSGSENVHQEPDNESSPNQVTPATELETPPPSLNPTQTDPTAYHK